jgi:hypothetical protein
MDGEKRLLLLHLKSDLKEVLKLSKEKSEELLSNIHSNNEKTAVLAEDLEYYISSLLDITREMKKLFEDDVPVIDIKSYQIDINSNEFDDFLGKLSSANDLGSLKQILLVLENWEFYELCAKVNEKIKSSSAKAG